MLRYIKYLILFRCYFFGKISKITFNYLKLFHLEIKKDFVTNIMESQIFDSAIIFEFYFTLDFLNLFLFT